MGIGLWKALCRRWGLASQPPLVTHHDLQDLHALATALIDRETLTRLEMEAILRGERLGDPLAATKTTGAASSSSSSSAPGGGSTPPSTGGGGGSSADEDRRRLADKEGVAAEADRDEDGVASPQVAAGGVAGSGLADQTKEQVNEREESS